MEIDKYKVEKLLGDGTFGRVLLCESKESKRKYAIKVIRPVERYIHSAKIEVKILERIKEKGGESPYIVKL